MSALLDFLLAAPGRVKGLLVGAAALAAVCLALTTWALVERVAAFQARAEAARAREETERVRTQLVAAIDQGKVLAEGLRTCNAGVDAARDAGAAAQAFADQVLEQLQALASGHAAASKRLEQLLKTKTPPGAGCREARAAIAARKAGAAP